MADEKPVDTFDSAEKAYAAAAESVTAVEAPVEAVAEPKAVAPVLKPEAPVKAKPAAPAKPAAIKIAAAKPVRVKKAAKAPAAIKPPVAAKAPVIGKPAKVATKKTVSRKAKPVAKPTATTTLKLKDTIMTTAKTKTKDFAGTVKGVIAEAQTKAKAAYEKGTAAVTEAGEFTKGNVEAFVESGKILTEGFKTLGNEYVAESKKAYETLTADAKEFATIKSPTDFFQLQTKLLRRNFESAFAFSTKSTEAAVKLAGDAIAPITSRVSIAVEKVKKAA